jgi:hypothetical protein
MKTIKCALAFTILAAASALLVYTMTKQPALLLCIAGAGALTWAVFQAVECLVEDDEHE